MHIDGNGDRTVFALEGDESKELRNIAMYQVPEMLALFQKKNKDYGSGAMFELGVRGQYSDIHRKMIKLKRAMWDGEELKFEGLEEVIQDLIGHLFLTLYMMETTKAAESEYIYGDDEKAARTFINMLDDDSKAFNLAAELPDELRKLVQGIVIKRAKEQAKDRAEKEAWVRAHPHDAVVDGADEFTDEGLQRIIAALQEAGAKVTVLPTEDPVSDTLSTHQGAKMNIHGTFPQWLHNRFGRGLIGAGSAEWDALSDSDKEYWVHQAYAVGRAYKRGGYKNDSNDHSRIDNSFDEVQQKLMAERLKRGEDERIEAMSMEAEGSTFSDMGFAESDQEQALGGYDYVEAPAMQFEFKEVPKEALDIIAGVKAAAPDDPRPILRTAIRQTETTLGALRDLYSGYSGL